MGGPFFMGVHMGAIAWVVDNGPALVQGATAVVTVASVITAATKTPKDDAILAGIRKVLDVLALNIGGARNAKR